jgi:hypothetical protein
MSRRLPGEDASHYSGDGFHWPGTLSGDGFPPLPPAAPAAPVAPVPVPPVPVFGALGSKWNPYEEEASDLTNESVLSQLIPIVKKHDVINTITTDHMPDITHAAQVNTRLKDVMKQTSGTIKERLRSMVRTFEFRCKNAAKKSDRTETPNRALLAIARKVTTELKQLKLKKKQTVKTRTLRCDELPHVTPEERDAANDLIGSVSLCKCDTCPVCYALFGTKHT